MNSKLHILAERLHNALLDYHDKNRVWEDSLAGACAVGSYLLASEAKRKLNLDVKLVAVRGHAWTEYRGQIYDVTASQFGHKGKLFKAKREVLSVAETWWHSYYTEKERIDLNYINSQWPNSQQPKNYQVKWLNQYKARIVKVEQ